MARKSKKQQEFEGKLNALREELSLELTDWAEKAIDRLLSAEDDGPALTDADLAGGIVAALLREQADEI